MTSRIAPRALALTAAVSATLVAGSFGFDTTVPVATAQVSAQAIPADATGNINIHKFVNTTIGEQANGQEMPTAGMGVALDGVEYKVERVQADVTTNAGLEAASKLTPDTAQIDTGFAAQTQTTADGGLATFSNLPVGVYLVTEVSAPDGVVKAPPFLVFLPMTNPDGSGWNFDVHAYPKNTETKVDKKIDDTDKNVGDDITYTITSDIPALANETTELEKYIVQDDLDEAMLTTSPDKVTVNVGGTEYVQGTDYNVTVDATTQQVEVVFTPAGLSKLTAAKRADDTVRVETAISATVGAIGDGTGVVTNDAKTITNNGGGGGDTTTPSNEVITRWGKVNINKKDEGGTALAGAIFSVYECTADGQTVGDALTLQGQDSSDQYAGSQFTTAADGTVVIDGLHVTNYENGAALPEPKNYCLVEEQAPAGFAKLREPIPFQLQEGAADVTGTDAEGNIEYTADVVNYKDNTLPGTGGMGVTFILIAGAAVVGAGAYAAKRNSKQA
ncbi:SpaH/EbpB family LPXTG-anchored major pilin [Corynebacterium incognita]|uniref:SpaH/EbpB family LPXTG-anchored major pilin n=1 Tax=Corynebacterium incognita TaxID=2754725 RepID=A0A7G7CP31_9CORY|nr:SpaH/EbpB family LPXTG-anchored major pilin [Corynebacterium incognita]QNE89347.1 SpaH/EbpB family LPXTG-anchored major pilin [Corynebacterium incognita]